MADSYRNDSHDVVRDERAILLAATTEATLLTHAGHLLLRFGVVC